MSQQNTNRKLYLAVKRNHLCAVLMSVSAKSRLWHLLTSAHNMVKGYYQHLSRYYTEFWRATEWRLYIPFNIKQARDIFLSQLLLLNTLKLRQQKHKQQEQNGDMAYCYAKQAQKTKMCIAC